LKKRYPPVNLISMLVRKVVTYAVGSQTVEQSHLSIQYVARTFSFTHEYFIYTGISKVLERSPVLHIKRIRTILATIDKM
jgi:hypothetical protein